MTIRPHRIVTARIELCGRLANPPALRVTPAGTAVLSLVVDCGANAGDLLMPVVWTGDEARAIASRLKNGIAVRIRGSLRATQSRMRSGTTGVGVEVVAGEIKLAEEALSDSIRKTNNG